MWVFCEYAFFSSHFYSGFFFHFIHCRFSSLFAHYLLFDIYFVFVPVNLTTSTFTEICNISTSCTLRAYTARKSIASMDFYTFILGLFNSVFGNVFTLAIFQIHREPSLLRKQTQISVNVFKVIQNMCMGTQRLFFVQKCQFFSFFSHWEAEPHSAPRKFIFEWVRSSQEPEPSFIQISSVAWCRNKSMVTMTYLFETNCH